MAAFTLIHATVKGHLLAMPALAAILTCESWIDRRVLSASIFCFAQKLLGESRPRRVRNAFSETVVVHHPVDVQIFHADDAELIDYFTRLLMREVVPLKPNALMDARHNLAPLGSLWRALFLFAQKTLRFGKCVLFGAKEARIIYMVARRKVGECFESNINADLCGRFRQRLRVFYLTSERGVPLASAASPDVAGLNLSFNGAVQFDVDIADFRECQVVSVNLKARLRESETIVAMLSPESRIARFRSSFDATKESLERKVKAHGNILQDLTVNSLQRFTLFFQHAKAVNLRVERKRLAAFFVSVFALFEQFVVQPTTFIQSVPQDGSLPLCRKDSVGERPFMHVQHFSTNLSVGQVATPACKRGLSGYAFIPRHELRGLLRGFDKTIGLHLHRPFADEQRTKEEPALCGNVSGENYVVIAEGGDLLATRPQHPLATYCLRCASIHTGKSIDELVGDWEQPILG